MRSSENVWFIAMMYFVTVAASLHVANLRLLASIHAQSCGSSSRRTKVNYPIEIYQLLTLLRKSYFSGCMQRDSWPRFWKICGLLDSSSKGVQDSLKSIFYLIQNTVLKRKLRLWNGLVAVNATKSIAAMLGCVQCDNRCCGPHTAAHSVFVGSMSISKSLATVCFNFCRNRAQIGGAVKLEAPRELCSGHSARLCRRSFADRSDKN